jgi:GNAT superfamily N-acetyltransferase
VIGIGTHGVRRARAGDAGGIARVWARAWRVAYRDLVPDTVLDAIDLDAKREQWRERLRNGDFTYVVEDRGIAGYCRIVLPREVASLYVLPERRRGGIGSALLETALDELRRHAPHAVLWVFKGNHAARAFYTPFGFTPDGTERIDPGTGLEEIRLRAEL